MKGKDNYFSGFFKKRYLSILVPFYVVIVVFILYFLAIGYKFTVGEFIGYITGWVLINTHTWYIVEIALLYLIFYLTFKFIKNENISLIVMTVVVIAMTAGSLLLGHGEYWFQGEWWYNTSLLFVVGIAFAKYKDKIIGFVKKFYIQTVIVTALISVGLYFASSLYIRTFFILVRKCCYRIYGIWRQVLMFSLSVAISNSCCCLDFNIIYED